MPTPRIEKRRIKMTYLWANAAYIWKHNRHLEFDELCATLKAGVEQGKIETTRRCDSGVEWTEFRFKERHSPEAKKVTGYLPEKGCSIPDPPKRSPWTNDQGHPAG